MSLSMRAQVLAVTVLVLVPVSWLLFQSSILTRREQQDYIRSDASMAARLVAASLLAHPGDEGAALVVAVGAMPPGTFAEVVSREGVRVAGSAPPDEGTYLKGQAPWGDRGTVTVFFPDGIAWSRTWPIYRRNYLLTVGATATTIGIIFFFARRWRLAMRALELQAQRVGAGGRMTSTPPVMPTSEMASLQRSFTEMERNLVSLERQVVRQERLAAIGVLVSGIAHELNNPLQAIAGRAELVGRDSTASDAVRRDLELIRKESARASAIIRNLSHFSRQQQESAQPIHLNDVVASVVELRQRELDHHGVTLIRDEQSEAPFLAVFAEVQQVILNFVVNAEQAMAARPHGARTLTIRTRDGGGRVRCEVEDTGPGVPVGDEAKLFQPFFTTKPVGEGTGLGLSVSYGIIESYGGAIGYRRAASGGAILWFDLPAHRT
jgi:signal transduction histidine kinase